MPWTRKQKTYQHALADPDDGRQTEEIAEALGVQPETLKTWENKKGFWAEVNRLAKTEAERALTSVWRALISRARRGDVPAIKLLFALLGQHPEPGKAPSQPVQFQLVVENGNCTMVTPDSSEHTSSTDRQES